MSSNLFDNQQIDQTNAVSKDSYWAKHEENKSLHKLDKSSKKVRDLSISLLTFTSLFVVLFVLFLVIFLMQLGYSNVYDTVPIKVISFEEPDKIEQVASGFSYISNNIFTSPSFTDAAQQAAWDLWVRMSIGFCVTAFIIFIVVNILLLVLNKKYGPDLEVLGILGGITEFIFYAVGFLAIAAIISFVVDWFEGGIAMAILAIVLIIFGILLVLALSIVTVTIFSTALSAYMFHTSNKEWKKEQTELNIQ